ncbi:hypothetical protein DRQ25_11890 [Candidatus Fermentibacteria bacterium]|nr:MAG: hypothetical protein DRQ25_11890 [Candidatus Fermentibacteria bacterium]
MDRKEIQKLKVDIKQGNMNSLLTYLKMLEDESLEKLVVSANNTRFYQAQTQAFRKIISLINQ